MATCLSTLGRFCRMCGWVLIMPFVMLSLIPAAVMPMQDTDGTMMLVLCTGDGPITTVVNIGDGEDDDSPLPRCDWAASTAVAALPDLIVPVRPAAFARATAARGADIVLRAHDPHGVMARGPPATF
jgi:hypothetical protein